MDEKPANWSGTCEDQVELFTEILAYLLAREILDRNRNCMSHKSFMRMGRQLIRHEQYYEKSIEHFDKMLTTWNVEYKDETCIRDALDNERLLSKAYQARIAALCPNGKLKKYAAVYEELE
jgi:hypothetical protein